MHNTRKKTKQLAFKPTAYGAGLRQDTTLLRATVHGVGNATSSAGGVIAFAAPFDPSGYGSTDWADFSSTYDEFRVMGVRITCFNHQFGVAVNGGGVAVAYDNDSAATPGTLSAVLQYSTCKYLPACWFTKPLQFTWWRPTKGEETTITWADVANPSTSLGSLQFYGQGLSASTQYMDIFYEFFCEFRGRR